MSGHAKKDVFGKKQFSRLRLHVRRSMTNVKPSLCTRVVSLDNLTLPHILSLHPGVY